MKFETLLGYFAHPTYNIRPTNIIIKSNLVQTYPNRSRLPTFFQFHMKNPKPSPIRISSPEDTRPIITIYTAQAMYIPIIHGKPSSIHQKRPRNMTLAPGQSISQDISRVFVHPTSRAQIYFNPSTTTWTHSTIL
jgi:hypothetical protein